MEGRIAGRKGIIREEENNHYPKVSLGEATHRVGKGKATTLATSNPPPS